MHARVDACTYEPVTAIANLRLFIYCLFVFLTKASYPAFIFRQIFSSHYIFTQTISFPQLISSFCHIQAPDQACYHSFCVFRELFYIFLYLYFILHI